MSCTEQKQSKTQRNKEPADWCWAIPFVHAQRGLAPLPNCECGTSVQTAGHVLTACLIIRHHMEHEI